MIALWATSGSTEWIAYTATLAVSAGVVYLLLGWFKMGWVSHFLRGGAGGLVFGFGVGLIVDQTPKILGVPKAEGSYFQVLIGVIKSLPETSIPTLIVGAISILILLLMRRFLPKLPRTIIVVILGIIVFFLARAGELRSVNGRPYPDRFAFDRFAEHAAGQPIDAHLGFTGDHFHWLQRLSGCSERSRLEV